MHIHIYLLFIDKKIIDYYGWYNISIYTIVNLDPVEMPAFIFNVMSFLENSRKLWSSSLNHRCLIVKPDLYAKLKHSVSLACYMV